MLVAVRSTTLLYNNGVSVNGSCFKAQIVDEELFEDAELAAQRNELHLRRSDPLDEADLLRLDPT